MTLTVVKFKKFQPPRLPYRRAARDVLGKVYELDLIFVTSAAMKNLNKIYRQRNKSSNVLSFALSPASGQLVLDPSLIKKEPRILGETFRKYLWRLFVHGILHLKGYDHERGGREGDKMSRAEERLLKIYKVK